MLNHKRNLFLIVCYCFVCLLWRVCKSFWEAHLHSALSSPNRCFKLSRNFDKDFFRCLLFRDAATISSNAERLLILCVSFFNTVEYYTPINNSDSANKSKSLFELINLIQIKESVVETSPIFSVVFTYLNYAFDMCSSRENQRYHGFDVRFHTRVGESHWFADKTYISERSYSSTTDNLLDFCINKTE